VEHNWNRRRDILCRLAYVVDSHSQNDNCWELIVDELSLGQVSFWSCSIRLVNLTNYLPWKKHCILLTYSPWNSSRDCGSDSETVAARDRGHRHWSAVARTANRAADDYFELGHIHRGDCGGIDDWFGSRQGTRGAEEDLPLLKCGEWLFADKLRAWPLIVKSVNYLDSQMSGDSPTRSLVLATHCWLWLATSGLPRMPTFGRPV
jgi:hypothetical protein